MLNQIYKKDLNKRTLLTFKTNVSFALLERRIRTYFDLQGYVSSIQLERLLFAWIKNLETKEKYEHTVNVVAIAKKIAKVKNIKADKVIIAAILHDCAKNIDGEILKKIILENNLKITQHEKEKTKRLHGAVGCFLAHSRLGIHDEEILNAIRYHSKGREAMNVVEHIVFLADKLAKIN